MKNYLITAGIALGVVVVWGALFAPVQKVINQTTQLGAVSSPDIMSPYFSFGGVRQWAAKTDSLAQATTTICALQSPIATSSLRFMSVDFSVSTTSASLVTVAKAANAFATTTIIGSQINIAAGGQSTIVASSTLSATGADAAAFIFAPSQWIVVGMQGSGAQTYSPSGTCQATWVQTDYI